jgi:aldehyde dehydrogenase (NAD+)
MEYEERIIKCLAEQKQKALMLRETKAQERIQWLKKMESWIKNNQDLIRNQIHADFEKPYPEIDITEIYSVLSEIKFAIRNLPSWMEPKKVPTPAPLSGSSSHIHYEPKGTCLIIAPWNYPFNMALGPLVSALAAGCTAVIKPSEMTLNTSSLIRRLVNEVFEPNHVAVFEGDADIATSLLSQPFDHIFFTGSPAVGKLIMQAASQNLTSVTLELGGKSPTVIEESADLKDAARKIAYGKFINSGQTCIAPDYLLVPEMHMDKFSQYLSESIGSMYNPDGKGMAASPDLAKVVNVRHFTRLRNLLADAMEKGANIITGGNYEEENRFLEPTVLKDLNTNMKMMQEEIFGPILPLIRYQTIDEAISLINSMPKPLAIYVFTKRKAVEKTFSEKTSSGGLVFNDCMLQFMQHELPFGGVNNSGIGKAHGYFGFLAFSNEKAIMKQRIGWTSSRPVYPPYSPLTRKIISSLLKWF